jgi:hypothetical protein
MLRVFRFVVYGFACFALATLVFNVFFVRAARHSSENSVSLAPATRSMPANSVTAPVVLEAEPERARTPVAPPDEAREDAKPQLEIEPARDELVAQREALLCELADVAARIERLEKSIAARDAAFGRELYDVSTARIGFLLPAPQGAGDLMLGAARFDPIVERSLDQVRMDLERYRWGLETRIDPPDPDSESSGFGFGCQF